MNTLRKDRELVRTAAARVISERQRLDQQTSRLRTGYDHYRPAILLGGGFLAGFLLGRKQLVQATRSIFSVANLGFTLMRSSLGSMLVATTLRKIPAADSNTKKAQG